MSRRSLESAERPIMAPSVSMRCFEVQCRIRGQRAELCQEKIIANSSNLLLGELQTHLDHYESTPFLYI